MLKKLTLQCCMQCNTCSKACRSEVKKPLSRSCEDWAKGLFATAAFFLGRLAASFPLATFIVVWKSFRVTCIRYRFRCIKICCSAKCCHGLSHSGNSSVLTSSSYLKIAQDFCRLTILLLWSHLHKLLLNVLRLILYLAD